MAIIKQEIKTTETEVNVLRKSAERLLVFKKATVIEGFNRTWKNKNFTPEQILTAMGTDCKAFFDESYAEQLSIKRNDPTWQMLVPPKMATFKDDGSFDELVDWPQQ